ncbi:Glycerol-3-phosphate regulon repressor [Serratia quinivorans]|uniref:DeoR/GlpR family DNA-binding transcription regulator n=1 Tax=Serratia quinivorans TaxID=137545 RepID=UPI00217A832D|nr:DeoR/GlpR family DNA-binding transcription regulator [Serratia quinivorans]CAI1071206.1 Glycerol-3-phosphate regulon repressor [Serratia quinivorans]CAI1597804.1 Glycerol-3-phosphate regulon repressor [Serratia quinivorans]CAI1636566.1 Glycerol-3-phosphate regulon repressor [Serratia quinivorans]CAI1663312.1 Glycerol-3-phosphate regulon repressor [Serratia quinivorans]CAI1749201.1 Glycerol-3-phosphate regulon repressor [Serratia quinivorans]
MSKLLPNQRHEAILTLLQQQGQVLAVEMAERLNTTEATIRRDLRQLAAQNLCKRIYGGALAPTPATGPIEARLHLSGDEKQALALAALALIKQDQVIFLDAGSTHLYLADLLPSDQGLTVVTNSLSIAVKMLERPGIRTILIGGELDADIGGCVDAKAVQEIDGFYFDIAFTGICAYEPGSGFSVLNYQDAQFKKRLLTRCGNVAVLCTGDKLNTYAPYSFLDASRVDYLVTPPGQHPQLEQQVTHSGGKVLYSDSPIGE